MAFGQTIDQRKQNKKNHIISLFRTHGRLSKAQARKESGYAMDTVISIFEDLITEQILIPTEGQQKTKGRKAAFFKLNHGREIYIGITFSQSGIHSSAVSFSREVLVTRTARLSRTLTREEFLNLLDSHITEIREALPDSGKTLRGVGCSVPGDVDPVTGILHSYTFLPNLKELPLGDRLRKRFPGIPVTIEHNIRSMTHYLTKIDDLNIETGRTLFISGRAGCAASILKDGEVITGHGEFGHMRVTNDPEDLCICGRRGCLDTKFSYNSFRTLGERAGLSSRDNQWDEEFLDALKRLYRTENNPIRRELKTRLRLFASALGDAVALTVPDQIILTGELFAIYGDSPETATADALALEGSSAGYLPRIESPEIRYVDLSPASAAQGVCYRMIDNRWAFTPEGPRRTGRN